MEKDENAKSWERPWTADEIRDHSSHWNLAGDAGLLNHLQQFSEKLLTRTQDTEVSLNKLTEDMKTSSIDIQNVMNTFLSLTNTQFVENRVYDDDEKETPPEEKKEDEKVKTKEEHEAAVIEKVREALHLGMSLLDTHFEAVEVPASDSEDDESSASVGRVILKPHNTYAMRPLPYIIGSQEFMEDDKVGLGDMSSDTEDSPDQNNVQSSESDDDIEHDDMPSVPKKTVVSSSSENENSEPESDRGEAAVKQKQQRMEIPPVEEEGGDMFGQESPPEADVLAGVQVPVSSAFTDELNAKLGGETRESPLPKPKKNETDNMFLPPTEPEEDNSLFGYSKGSFSGGRGLFDDLDDWNATSNSLWKTEKDSLAKVTEKLPKESEKDVKQSYSSGKKIFRTDNQAQSLFDDKEEDDLFSTSSQKSRTSVANVLPPEHKRSLLPETQEHSVREGSIFSNVGKPDGVQVSGSPISFGKDDAEDDLFAVPSVSNSSQDTTRKKKLPGAVPVFSDVNIFGEKSTGHSKILEKSDGRQQLQKIIDQPRKPQDVPSAEPKKDIPRTDNTILPREEAPFRGPDEYLFQPSAKADKGRRISNLFDKDENDGDENDSLFSKPKTISAVSKNVPVTKSLMPASTGAKPKKAISLFDDSDSGDDEILFSSTSSTSSRSRRSQASGDLLSAPVEKKILPKKPLDDLFSGIDTQEDPDFDVFNSKDQAAVSRRGTEKSSASGTTLDFPGSGRRVTSGLFDNIDEVDDIFSITKATPPKKQPASSIPQPKSRSNLFSDKSEEADDIFSSKSGIPGRDVGAGDNKNTFKGVSIESKPVPAAKKVEAVNEGMKEKPSVSQKPVIGKKPSSVPLPNTNPSSNPEKNESKDVIKIENNERQANKILEEVKSSEGKNVFGEADETNKVSSLPKATLVQSSKPEPPKTLNIRKTTDVLFETPSNEDDLFESSWPENSTDVKPKSPEMNASSNSLSALLKDYDSAEGKSSILGRESPKVEGAEKMVGDLKGNTKGEKPAERSPPKVMKSLESRMSPGKFVIDPRALLPGAKHPGHPQSPEAGVGFDKPVETSGMLQSAGKERVKIQVKRRPQTRRARQEALRASTSENDNLDPALVSQGSDKRLTGVNNISPPNTFQQPSTNSQNGRRNVSEDPKVNSSDALFGPKPAPAKQMPSRDFEGNSNPLSPSTDEEDLFAVPQELPYDEPTSRDQPQEYKNMFGGAPVLSPVDSATGNGDMFDSEKSISTGNVTAATTDSMLESHTVSKDVIFGSGVSNAEEELYKRDISGSMTDDSHDIFSVQTKGFLSSSPFSGGGDSLLKSKLKFDDSDEDDLFSSVKKDAPCPHLEDDFSLFPPKSTDVFGSTKGNNLFSPSGEDSENLFTKKTPGIPKNTEVDEPRPSSSLLGTVPSKDLQATADIQTDPDVDNGFLGNKSDHPVKQTRLQTNTLFGDSAADSDDLFGSSAATSKKAVLSNSSKLRGSLFDDTGDDDDIFSASSSKSKSRVKDAAPSERLFSESSDDNSDLFSTRTNTSKSQKVKQPTVQKKNTTEETFEDPLMAIKK